MGFFDLHSHVLPGLDDGAPDGETSRAMLEGLAELGFDTVCATPHQRAGVFMPEAGAIADAHAEARRAAGTFGLELHLAAENMWDDVFYTRCQRDCVPGYRQRADDEAQAFLIELPLVPNLPPGLFDRLFDIQLAGRLPVLAHPERYSALWKNWDDVETLARVCALVVDLGAVAGYHGRKQGKMARKLVKSGLAHAVASDAHSVNDVRVAAEGIAWIRKKVGEAEVERLLDHNPRRIFAAEHPGLKLAVNIGLSLAMLAACLWLVWPEPDQAGELRNVFERLTLADFWPFLGAYVGLLAVTHFCRAYRWNNLLEPIGARQPTGRLLAISSVGFMAILALPARLGEFVRPALIRKKGHVTATAALGTIAVERIVDGLLVSMFLFVTLVAKQGPDTPVAAYVALAVFAAALVFLVFAVRAPDRTVRACVRLSCIRLVSDRAARAIELRLRELVGGFAALGDRRNLLAFCVWSLAYWLANGLGMWVLARGFGLELSIVGALAVMSIVAVGITLPNAPGLVGQFQFLTVVGLSLFVGQDVANSTGLAYAIVLHAIQVVWYLGIGAAALATRHVSFAEAFTRSAAATGKELST